MYNKFQRNDEWTEILLHFHVFYEVIYLEEVMSFSGFS